MERIAYCVLRDKSGSAKNSGETESRVYKRNLFLRSNVISARISSREYVSVPVGVALVAREASIPINIVF